MLVDCTTCKVRMSPPSNETEEEFEHVPALLAAPEALMLQVAAVSLSELEPTAAFLIVSTTVMAPPAGAGELYTFPPAVKPPTGIVHAEGIGNQNEALKV